MADLEFLERSSPVQIVGGDESFSADVLATNELASVDVVRVEGVQGFLTVGTTAIEIKVGANRFINRKAVTIYNNSNSTLFWGYTDGVTTLTGTPIDKKEIASFRIGDCPLFIIAATAGNNVRITEGY